MEGLVYTNFHQTAVSTFSSPSIEVDCNFILLFVKKIPPNTHLIIPKLLSFTLTLKTIDTKSNLTLIGPKRKLVDTLTIFLLTPHCSPNHMKNISQPLLSYMSHVRKKLSFNTGQLLFGYLINAAGFFF